MWMPLILLAATGAAVFMNNLTSARSNLRDQLVITIPILAGGKAIHLENAGLFWMPLVAIAVLGAARYMNNLASARSSFRDQLAITRRKHTWIMAWLYIGTFGSFIGYSAAFPLLIKTQFPEITSNLAFLGALVGSVARPLGGKLADRIGGARVTLWNFVVMGAATVGVLYALDIHSFPLFLAMFLTLFVTTGIGNGSTYRMIPAIFRRQAARSVEGQSAEVQAATMAQARRTSAAVLGFIGAIGALGGYMIPRAFGASIKATGGAATALSCFLVFYGSCIAITWWNYTRTTFLARTVPSLAKAGI